MNLFEIGLVIFLFNIPFGYWRANVKKFSLQWIFAIHLPVPFVVALRFLSGIGFALISYPVFAASFFLGQFAGSEIFKWWKNKAKVPQTSCLACDIFRIIYFKQD